jgi:pimeloyl-ACP methyl ester carboxylesterase
MLKCPKKEIIWFDKSAHRMDIEEPDKFQQEILKIAK